MSDTEKLAEAADSGLLQPRLVRRVLLLCSYCGDDNTECSDDFPCPECLQMNNVAEVDADAIQIERVIGGLEYLKDIRDGKNPPNIASNLLAKP